MASCLTVYVMSGLSRLVKLNTNSSQSSDNGPLEGIGVEVSLEILPLA